MRIQLQLKAEKLRSISYKHMESQPKGVIPE
jgi:hypothetical protein